MSSSQLLCPFSVNKECPYGDDCEYMHGTMCELCGQNVLKPGDKNQNEEHEKVCVKYITLVLCFSKLSLKTWQKPLNVSPDLTEPHSVKKIHVVSV